MSEVICKTRGNQAVNITSGSIGIELLLCSAFWCRDFSIQCGG